MSWREKKLQARFRGIQFHVEAHDRSGSRRYAVTEIPQGDEPVVQDMGAGLQHFRLDAFLLGSDYMARRDVLLRALEEPGPGLLIHPWHGQHRVVVENFTVQEGVGAGGRVDFSIQFLRLGPLQGRKRHGSSRAARIASVSVAAGKATDAASADFAANLLISGVAGFVTDAAEEEVRGFVGRIEDQARHLQGKGAGLLRRMRSMVDDPIGKLINPKELAIDIIEAVQEVENGIKSRETALRVLLDLAVPSGSTVHGQSDQSEVARANGKSFAGLFSAAALGAACKRAVSEDWASREAALEVRTRLKTAIDHQAQGVSHSVWSQLHGLAAAVSEVLPGPEGELPEIRAVELDAPEPALLMAYRLHGNTDGAADLVARNGVAHPMFVPAGTVVEVLVNG